MPKEKTKRIDKQFKGVGRIALASGTNKVSVFNVINSMLDDMYDRGRLDDLKAIQSRHVTPMQAYNTWKSGKLVGVASVAHVTPLKETLTEYLENKKCAPDTLRGYQNCLNQLLKKAKPTATIADLPHVLETYKRHCEKNEITKSFNQTRAMLLGYLKKSFKPSSEIYREVLSIEVIPYTRIRKPNPQTVEQITAMCAKLRPDVAAMVWTMCTIGTIPKEYLKDGIDDLGYGIHIKGKKRTSRDRIVPRVIAPVQPVLQSEAFTERIKEVDPSVALKDFRNTYMVWMEEAGILASHRKAYAGWNTSSSMQDLYLEQDMKKYLAADAKTMQAYINKPTYSADQQRAADFRKSRNLPDPQTFG
jgi:hypothetical protein